jgi:hypothetical protein
MSLLSILIPALLAGLVAVLATVAIERWGGVVGGLLGTLPTTIVPASIGIAGNTDAAGFADAMYAVPVGMLIDVIFLSLWRLIPPRLPPWRPGARLAATAGVALATWLSAASAAVLLLDGLRLDGSLAWLGLTTTGLMIAVGVAACLDRPPAPGGTRPVGPLTLAARGTLAAAAIAAAVSLAAVGGALAAGIASVFPAIFLTTMVSLWISQGETVPSGAVGPMMLGASSVAAYALLTTLAVPALGIAAGAAVAWLGAAAAVTLPAWYWLEARSAR